jgi:hypothetical protein
MLPINSQVLKVVNFSGSYTREPATHFATVSEECYNSNQQMQPIFIKIMCICWFKKASEIIYISVTSE